MCSIVLFMLHVSCCGGRCPLASWCLYIYFWIRRSYDVDTKAQSMRVATTSIGVFSKGNRPVRGNLSECKTRHRSVWGGRASVKSHNMYGLLCGVAFLPLLLLLLLLPRAFQYVIVTITSNAYEAEERRPRKHTNMHTRVLRKTHICGGLSTSSVESKQHQITKSGFAICRFKCLYCLRT